MKALWMTGVCVLAALYSLQAQNEVDAIRFSNTQVPGTARSLGMGGAFGALGADGSAFWINPAGLGVYRRGGVEVTLGLSDYSSAASYEGNTARDGRANLTVQSLSLNSTRMIENSPWKSYTIGVGYGKHNNFHEHITIEGNAANTTMLDIFAQQANGTPSGELMDAFPFGAGLAWESYVIDPLSTEDLTYVPSASGGSVAQRKTMEREGAMTETSFGFGANYDDWLYLGGTVSFNGINYTDESRYRETFEQTDNLSTWQYSEELRVTGTGIGLKIGAIARVSEWLRVGAAWHSGVRYGLTDTYNAEISSQFTDGGMEGFESPVNVSNYALRTPSRIHGSAAFVLGDAGVITADYEFTDFGSIRMEGTASNEYSFDEENQTIGAIYRSAHRVRSGAEFRMAESWRVRGGVQYAQTPFVPSANSNSAQLGFTAGAGFRYDAFFADLAAMFVQRTEDYFFYDPRMVQPASIGMSRLSFLLSGGIRF